MIPERLTSIPSGASHGAALSARTHAAEADAPHVVHPESIVERVNAYGFQTHPVSRVVHPDVARYLLSLYPSIAFGMEPAWPL